MIKVGHAHYARPCIIYDDGPELQIWVIALSTKEDSQRGQSFKLDSTHPDFPATGLKETSYTIHPMQLVSRSDIGKKLGVLQGSLAKELMDYLGL